MYALYDYIAASETEVTIQKCQEMNQVEGGNDEWMMVCLSDGSIGCVPRTYVSPGLGVGLRDGGDA